LLELFFFKISYAPTLNRTQDTNTRYKHVIVIPNEIIEKAFLKSGDDLTASVSKGEIRLKKID